MALRRRRGATQATMEKREHRDGGVEWRVAMKPGRRRLLGEGVAEEAAEKRKASVRAKVEHPFLYVKRHFGYAKVRYRGVAKNRQRIALLLGFSNLLIAGRYATGWQGSSLPAAGGTAGKEADRRGYRRFAPYPVTKAAPGLSAISSSFTSKPPLPLETANMLFRLSLPGLGRRRRPSARHALRPSSRVDAGGIMNGYETPW